MDKKYMPVKINGWELTDSDYYQYYRYKGERVYEFIQMVWLDVVRGDEGYPNKCYAVCTDEIHLKDFFLHEIETTIAAYGYDDIIDMEQKYQLPIGQLDELIAECYFEDHCLCDSCSLGGLFTEEEAKQKILEYITKE